MSACAEAGPLTSGAVFVLLLALQEGQVQVHVSHCASERRVSSECESERKVLTQGHCAPWCAVAVLGLALVAVCVCSGLFLPVGPVAFE